MTTTTINNTQFIHHGDFLGEMIILDQETGKRMSIPFEDIKELVAEYIRSEKILKFENMETDELLSLKSE